MPLCQIKFFLYLISAVCYMPLAICYSTDKEGCYKNRFCGYFLVFTSLYIQTDTKPGFFISSLWAASPDKSIILFFKYGPRSLTLTITLRPFSRLITFKYVPKGNCLCAAVNALGSYLSPFAVRWPALFSPYHEAIPIWAH